jgi:hypothetical protein
MLYVRPMPFEEAIDKSRSLFTVGSPLDTEAWRDAPLALRDNAFFSATIENGRWLQSAKDFIDDFLKGSRVEAPSGGTMLSAGSRTQFVKELSDFAVANGLSPLDPKDEGTLKDIRSEARLSLIYNTKTQQAHDYGYWKQGQNPDVLDAFPAQQFIREAEVGTPRPIHQQNEGAIRLKSDLSFWLAMNSPDIGGFGVPWGPWGFNSGMGVEDVPRDVAEQLGLIAPGERAKPIERDFNDRLQASAAGLDDDTLDQLRAVFGDQVEIDDAEGSIRWRKPQKEATP